MNKEVIFTSDDEYIEKIVSRYLHLKQRGLIISPRDWQFICFWLARNIPIDTVLKALDIAFSEVTEHTARVRSLSYTDRIISRLEYERKLMRVGRPLVNETRPLSLVLRDGLTNIIGELIIIIEKNPSLAIHIEKSIINIRRLIDEIEPKSLDLDDVIKRTAKIEDGLFNRIFKNLSLNEKELYIKKAEKTLQKFKVNMPEKAYKKTKKLLLKSIVMKDKGLPPFNPFI
ncbi:MAG: hypothetical protein ACUVWP_09420 [bacterium]